MRTYDPNQEDIPLDDDESDEDAMGDAHKLPRMLLQVVLHQLGPPPHVVEYPRRHVRSTRDKRVAGVDKMLHSPLALGERHRRDRKQWSAQISFT